MLEAAHATATVATEASPALVSANYASMSPKVEKLALDEPADITAPEGWVDKLGRAYHPSLLGGDCLC